MDSPMEHDCLTPAEVPHLTRLYSDFLSRRDGHPRTARISGPYRHQPTAAGIKEAARALKRGGSLYPAEMRAEVAEILATQNAGFCGGALPAELERNLSLLKKNAVAVVTGQQVGLFGGPAYTFYKAISALRIVEQLRKNGAEAVPVFWMAGEDHDLEEVNHVYWPSAAALECLDWLGGEEQAGRSVGSISLGPEITPLVRKAADLLGGPGTHRLSDILSSAYQPGQTLGSAFARMMAALFGERGLILLDPLDGRLHRLAAPLLRRAVAEQSHLTAALLAQNKVLEAAGYHAQVKVTDRSTLLFTLIEGKRAAVVRRNSEFVAAGRVFSAAELDAAIEAHPESFSPNALLRPVVQDTLLPTAAYIGGPAEVAYFEQNRVVYERLLGRMPVILPRASFTLVEPPVERLLKRYGLAVRDVFRGRQHLRVKMERQNVPRGLANRFAAEKKNLARMLGGLRKPLGKLDSTLAGALDTAEKKMLYQLGKLQGKAGRAADFRVGVLNLHEQAIREALFPLNGLQERSLSLLPFLARNGLELLDQLGKDAGFKSAAHCLVRL